MIIAAVCLPVCLSAQPVVRLLEPSSQSAVSAPTIALKGVAAADSPIVNIYWTDHRGHTGAAEWTPATSGQSSVAFSASVPVHPGANRITTIAVDSRNRSGSAQLSVYSEAPRGPAVAEVQSGWWHGRPVTYAVINGQAVVEGDIILGPAAQIAGSAPPGGPSGPVVKPRGFAIGYTSQLWTAVDGVYQIPYTIETGTPILDSVISYVNSTLTGVIQLVPQTNQANYVTFNFDPTDTSGYCEATEGMAGGQQFIGGSINCSFTGICHEIGHAIGLLHEHQRPDRNTYVVLTPANADKPYLLGNFDFFSDDYQTIGLYDYASVMHYPAFSFTKNNLPVLESIPAGIPLSNTVGYSAGDVDAIERLYGFTPSAVTVVTNPPGLEVIVDSTTYTTPHTFTWTLNSRHTLNLPPDPQLTNPNDGATYEFTKWNDGGARSHTVTAVGGSGSLTSPAGKPATTVYEANFIRLWPFAIAASPAAGGSVAVSPAPQAVFNGSFFVDRQKITVSATPNSGYNFYGWFGPPYPQGGNPYPFLIQAPESSVQGAFTTFPVTTIGEAITGPNTWNPPMYATVDTNSYVYLPQGYSQDQSGAAWAPGTTHSIGVLSSEAPVTTNVSYTWNDWTDGGAQTHNIRASSSGVKKINASFTPVYVSYTYAENACGTVSYSQSCPNNYCSFPDGTVLAMTATPTAGNGMIFSGWTGDLTGTTNPQEVTIHDEFLPVANFNIVPTIVNAATVSPASPVKTSAASQLTVTGAGFVNGSFYAYWNNAYRSSTGVTPTQATIQLNAGDLSAAGAQLLQVSNFTNTTPSCGAYAFSQVLVKSTYGNPSLTITKSHTGNFTQGETGATYTVTVANAATSTGPTSGTVTVTDTIPSGLTLVSMAGTGWTCESNICTRTDSLATGKSYPAITVTVDVAANAPAQVTNTVTVSGGRSAAASASNPTTID
ncbi:MAG TPA: M12 family metallopeptidase [Bryobacteraceae bacterium]|nr:M12 family metallopeptidase [Bryobacteraceae bacterium]